ncbi:MAG: 50S ribosomal protein L29 [Saprospiraceae bacterium]|nr:50S ribosomal protein L29 [Saprospiraceae bacterium]
MANKKNQDIVALSETDIKNTLIEISMDLQKARFTHSVKGLDNPSQLKVMRKKIARLKTEERSREVSKLTEAELSKRTKIRARRKKTINQKHQKLKNIHSLWSRIQNPQQ